MAKPPTKKQENNRVLWISIHNLAIVWVRWYWTPVTCGLFFCWWPEWASSRWVGLKWAILRHSHVSGKTGNDPVILDKNPARGNLVHSHHIVLFSDLILRNCRLSQFIYFTSARFIWSFLTAFKEQTGIGWFCREHLLNVCARGNQDLCDRGILYLQK